jgi:hypothetical protein
MSTNYPGERRMHRDDDLADARLPQAVAVGLLAALVGGAAWAIIVRVTNFEVGYVAWAVGLLVGAAMSRVTAHRTKTLGATAAGLALLGLLFGKAFIFASSAGPIAKGMLANAETMEGTVAWQMYEARELEPATLDSVDARLAARDTISDALWAHMREQSAARLQAMNGEQKEAVARNAANRSLRQMGMINGVMAQFSAFDLLWVFLAVGTAHRMMTHAKPEPAAVTDEDAQAGRRS